MSTRAAVAAASSGASAAQDLGASSDAAPVDCISIAELKERDELMFTVETSEPVATGRGSAMPHATKELVQRVWDLALALPDERRDALSRAYGNFDKVVMMGWLIGDVVLGRQIDRADAHAVGRKVGKLGPTFKAEFGAPSRRVGKRKWQSEEARARADAEASAEESRLRRDRVSLPLPEAAPPVPLKRKRVQVSPLKAEREMPSEMSDDDSPRDESCASFNLAGVLKRGVRCAEDGVKRALELQERAHAQLAQEAAAAEWSRGVLKMALLAVDRARRELEKHGPEEPAGWVGGHHRRGDWELNQAGWEAERDRRLMVQSARRHAEWAVRDAEQEVQFQQGEVRTDELVHSNCARFAAYADEGVASAYQELELRQSELLQGDFILDE